MSRRLHEHVTSHISLQLYLDRHTLWLPIAMLPMTTEKRALHVKYKKHFKSIILHHIVVSCQPQMSHTHTTHTTHTHTTHTHTTHTHTHTYTHTYTPLCLQYRWLFLCTTNWPLCHQRMVFLCEVQEGVCVCFKTYLIHIPCKHTVAKEAIENDEVVQRCRMKDCHPYPHPEDLQECFHDNTSQPNPERDQLQGEKAQR